MLNEFDKNLEGTSGKKEVRLKRPCRRCDKMFTPEGKRHYICNKCNKRVNE